MRTDQPRFRKPVKAAVQLLPFPIARLDGATYYRRFRALVAFNSAHGRRYLVETFVHDFGSQWLEHEVQGDLVSLLREYLDSFSSLPLEHEQLKWEGFERQLPCISQ